VFIGRSLFEMRLQGNTRLKCSVLLKTLSTSIANIKLLMCVNVPSLEGISNSQTAHRKGLFRVTVFQSKIQYGTDQRRDIAIVDYISILIYIFPQICTDFIHFCPNFEPKIKMLSQHEPETCASLPFYRANSCTQSTNFPSATVSESTSSPTSSSI
jgi:hypothetical protein